MGVNSQNLFATKDSRCLEKVKQKKNCKANLYKQNAPEKGMPKKKEVEAQPSPAVTEKAAEHPASYATLEQRLLENLVELQKVHTHLAEKFDNLSDQIAQLLGLFEMAARSFGEQPANQVVEKDKEFLEKVDKLLEQNKTIAKGLTLVEERIRERMYGSPKVSQPPEKDIEEQYTPSTLSKPLPRF